MCRQETKRVVGKDNEPTYGAKDTVMSKDDGGRARGCGRRQTTVVVRHEEQEPCNRAGPGSGGVVKASGNAQL